MSLAAKTDGPAVPYKLGTFEREGKAFMGLVLRDTQVIDIAQANAAFENGNGSAGKLVPPADMKELISSTTLRWKDRLAAIARAIPAEGGAPAFAYALDSVKALPPVRPALILNAGGNYDRAHRRDRGAAAARGRRCGTSVQRGDRTRDLGAEGRRHARQPVPVHQVADRRRRPHRSDRDAARTHEHRLRM